MQAQLQTSGKMISSSMMFSFADAIYIDFRHDAQVSGGSCCVVCTSADAARSLSGGAIAIKYRCIVSPLLGRAESCRLAPPAL